MNARVAIALMLASGMGCVAAPREMPVLQAPPIPMSTDDSGDADPVGAWSSVSLKGPGSAAFRRVDLILHEDGRCLFVGEAEDGPKTFTGRYTWAAGTLTVVRPDGRTLRCEARREGSVLILTEGKLEMRLRPIGP
jgi:hypothetical protein